MIQRNKKYFIPESCKLWNKKKIKETGPTSLVSPYASAVSIPRRLPPNISTEIQNKYTIF